MTLHGSRRRAWHAFALAFALLGAGCANLPPSPASTGAEAAAQGKRAYRQDIVLEGRLSLRYRQNQEDRSVHGSFVWTQNGSLTTLRLLSPLGQTLAVIDIKPGLATLTQSGQPPRSAADADALTAQTLGWPLPIAGMRNWLQGFAIDAGGKSFVAQAPAGGDEAVTVNTRDGWRIQYLNWQTADAGINDAGMPKRIDLERYTEQAGEVAIRIVIDKVS
ncbi:MAG TPA: lipoprotein insertase outer membrane protein LolB [Herbaspirillum sp.]|jgi:outer membrane lipoprotein LolB